MKPVEQWSTADLDNVSRLYELYQLHWMMSHGRSLEELVNSIDEYAADADSRSDILTDWESDCGFNGSLYVCFNEFKDAELLDDQYMSELVKMSMNPDLIDWYKDFSQDNSKEVEASLKVKSVYPDNEILWAEVSDQGRMACIAVYKEDLNESMPDYRLSSKEYQEQLVNIVSNHLKTQDLDIVSLPHITEANSATRELFKEVYESENSMCFIEHDDIEDPSVKAEFIRQVDEDIARFNLDEVIEKNAEDCLYVCYGNLASSFSIDDKGKEMKLCKFECASNKKQQKENVSAAR